MGRFNVGWAVALVLAALSFAGHGQAAGAEPKTSVAVIAGEEKAAPNEAVAATLQVALSNEAGVRLVEREHVASLLKEQKVALSGAADEQTMLLAGKLVAADLFVFLERVALEATKPVERVRQRIVETRTGVVLDDRLDAAYDPDKTAAALAQAVRSAVATSLVPEGKRRYVSVLNLQSEEFGPTLDPLAQALRGILEQDIRGLPGVFVLERSRMRRLVQEKELTALEQSLRASAVLIEGGLSRDLPAKRLRATVRLLRLSDKAATQVQAEALLDDTAAARRAIAVAISGALAPGAGSQPARRDAGSANPGAPADIGSEAMLFALRGDSLAAHGLYADAISPVEAALALGPSETTRAVALRVYQNFFNDYGPGIQPDQYEAALRGYIRHQEIGQDWVREKIERVRRGEAVRWILEPMLSPAVPRIPASSPTLARLKEQAFGARDQRNAALLDFLRPGSPNYLPGTAQYSDILNEKLRSGMDRLHDYAAFTDFAKPLIEESERLEESGTLPSFNVLEATTALFYALGDKGKPAVPGRSDIAPLIEWCVGRPNALTRVAAHMARNFRAGEGNPAADAGAAEVLRIIVQEIAPKPQWGRELHNYQSQFRGWAFRQILPSIKPAARVDAVIKPLVDDAVAKGNAVGFTTLAILLHERAGLFESADRPAEAARALALLDRKLPPDLDSSSKAYRDLLVAMAGPKPSNPATQAAKDSLWDAYELREIQLGPLPHEDDQLCTFCPTPQGLVTLWYRYPGRMNASENPPIKITGQRRGPDGKQTRLGQVEFPFQKIELPVDHSEEQSNWRIAADGDTLYAASSRLASGLVVMSPAGSRILGEKEGMPTGRVQTMALFDGALYMGLSGDQANPSGALVRYVVQTGKFETLASTRSVEHRNELDGGTVYEIRTLLPDPQRNCLYLWVTDYQRGRDGLWRFDLKTRAAKCVIAKPYPCCLEGLAWTEKGLLIGNWGKLDPDTLKVDRMADSLGGFAEFRWPYLTHGDTLVSLHGGVFVHKKTERSGTIGDHPMPPIPNVHHASGFYVRYTRDGTGGNIATNVPVDVFAPCRVDRYKSGILLFNDFPPRAWFLTTREAATPPEIPLFKPAAATPAVSTP
ncbi:MAG: hypothetical protein NTW19_08395 [Planctomycetota bacterium]|nr:hypothetical protein [Planctomycetota bacterium]